MLSERFDVQLCTPVGGDNSVRIRQRWKIRSSGNGQVPCRLRFRRCCSKGTEWGSRGCEATRE